jgi:hypothetical protein
LGVFWEERRCVGGSTNSHLSGCVDVDAIRDCGLAF